MILTLHLLQSNYGLNNTSEEINTFVSYLFLTARLQKVVVESSVRPKQVSFDSSRWLYRDFGSVLQDVDGKVGRGHAGQPKSKVLVNLYTM